MLCQSLWLHVLVRLIDRHSILRYCWPELFLLHTCKLRAELDLRVQLSLTGRFKQFFTPGVSTSLRCTFGISMSASLPTPSSLLRLKVKRTAQTDIGRWCGLQGSMTLFYPSVPLCIHGSDTLLQDRILMFSALQAVEPRNLQSAR